MGLRNVYSSAFVHISPFFYDCTEENTRKAIKILILYVKEFKIETMV